MLPVYDFSYRAPRICPKCQLTRREKIAAVHGEGAHFYWNSLNLSRFGGLCGDVLEFLW